MRASSIFACVAGCAAAVFAVACAASGTDAKDAPQPDSGGSVAVLPDGGSAESDADPDASVDVPQCSEAGWCATALPDPDLSMRDISVLEHRAFAVAESPTLGVKVLEWDEADGWKYIDDGSQNEFGIGEFVGKVWAPNDDEVYYGVDPGYIYHGKRPVPPETAWSWTRNRLQDDDGNPVGLGPGGKALSAITKRDVIGVWGTSASDVYAWIANRIYRWKSVDGGTPGWALEHVADDADPDEYLFFSGAAGTGPDGVWFSGTRARDNIWQCALVVRKSVSEYRRVADGVLPRPQGACTPRDGTLLIGGSVGWLSSIHALSPDGIIGLNHAPDIFSGVRNVVKISANGDTYSVAVSSVPTPSSGSWLYSLASVQEGLWLGGWGRVVRGTDVWDGGRYELSTVALQGPLNRPVLQVRGTSNTNLWAIGDDYALHKTTL